MNHIYYPKKDFKKEDEKDIDKSVIEINESKRNNVSYLNFSNILKNKDEESKLDLDNTGYGNLGNISNSNMWDISCIKK